jgi:hypothetical protein
MPRWNVDTIVAYLAEVGCEIGEDNDGQIVLYTGLSENAQGDLINLETGEKVEKKDKKAMTA